MRRRCVYCSVSGDRISFTVASVGVRALVVNLLSTISIISYDKTRPVKPFPVCYSVRFSSQ